MKRALAVSFVVGLSILVSPAFGANAAEVVTDGLVSWWTFDDQSNPGKDKWGTSNGSLVGCTWTNQTAGPASKGALYFSGASYVALPQTFEATTNRTYEAWVRSTSDGSYRESIMANFYWGYGPAPGRRGFCFMAYSFGRYYFIHYYSDTIAADGAISAMYAFSYQTWHHAAAVIGSTNVTGYLDGAVLFSGPFHTNEPGGTYYNALIGNDVFGLSPFHGFIDEVRVYNKALTPADIQQNMKAIKLQATVVSVR
jgi:hypothetical protein